nr:MAG TPA: hypothetical protein [Caudoviricetes sp.]
MNYEFHVGDYVKTRAGDIGYIESTHDFLNGVTGFYVRFVDNNCHCFIVSDKTISSNFARIGAYDFTKKEKKKIDMIDGVDIADPEDRGFIIDKINELVDAVNELIDKENNE